MYQLGVSLGRLVKEEGVDVRLNTTVDKAYAEKENADVIIVAAGSSPLVPPIPGLDGDNVIVINDLHHNLEKVQDSVVVLGGGLAGCEAAIHFAREGKSVKLVEMRDTLSPDANIRHRPLLLQEIDNQGIEVYMNHKGMKVSEDGVLCENKDGEQVMLEGKTVICALGQRANRAIVDELIDAAPIVKTIGDCVKVSTITTAMYQGYHAGLDV